MAFPLAQLEEEARRDEETERREREAFDEWWCRYQQTAKKW